MIRWIRRWREPTNPAFAAHAETAPSDATIGRALVDPVGIAELAVTGDRPALLTGLAGLHPGDPVRAAQAIAAVREHIDAWPSGTLSSHGRDLARLVLADCCPHPVCDRLDFCTACLADVGGTDEPMGEWGLVHNSTLRRWELLLGDLPSATTDRIEPGSTLEAWGWAAMAVEATGVDVLAFDERPGRYGDVEYVAVLAAPGQEV